MAVHALTSGLEWVKSAREAFFAIFLPNYFYLLVFCYKNTENFHNTVIYRHVIAEC